MCLFMRDWTSFLILVRGSTSWYIFPHSSWFCRTCKFGIYLMHRLIFLITVRRRLACNLNITRYQKVRSFADFVECYGNYQEENESAVDTEKQSLSILFELFFVISEILRPTTTTMPCWKHLNQISSSVVMVSLAFNRSSWSCLHALTYWVAFTWSAD